MAYGGIAVHKKQCQRCIYTEAGEGVRQRIHMTHEKGIALAALHRI